MSRLVDTREPWELRELLIQTGWEQQTLHSGDMSFSAHDMLQIGVTRKTVTDLITSVGEVLSQQLEIMLENYGVCIFLIEDDNRVRWDQATDQLVATVQDKVFKIDRRAYLHFLHRFYVKGFASERSPSLAYTVQRLNELYALYQKPYSRSGISRRYADDRILAFPSGLRGKVGEGILLGKSLREVAYMSLGDWQNCDGIGAKRAATGFQHFNRR
jgi:ERCC4-type nuclease